MRTKLTKGWLWKLRQEIVLNSLYYKDYENSFGYDSHDVCDFFDGYLEDLGNQMKADGISDNDFFKHLPEYDTPQNLWNWYEDLVYAGNDGQFPFRAA
jgi:hypothetical protein